MCNDFWPAFGGAVVGGFFALGAQWYANYSQREYSRNSEIENTKNVLNSLIINLNSHLNDLKKIKNHINYYLKEKNNKEAFFHVDRFESFKPEIQIESFEYSAIIQLKDSKILNGIQDFTSSYKSVIFFVVNFNDRAEKISRTDLMPIHDKLIKSNFDWKKCCDVNNSKTLIDFALFQNGNINKIDQEIQKNIDYFEKTVAELSRKSRCVFNTNIQTNLAGDVDVPHWTKRPLR